MRIEHNLNNSLDIKGLCSRKLWEMLTTDEINEQDSQTIDSITNELLERKHYLTELERLLALDSH